MTEPYIDREASGGWLIFITSFFALFNWVLAYFRFGSPKSLIAGNYEL